MLSGWENERSIQHCFDAAADCALTAGCRDTTWRVARAQTDHGSTRSLGRTACRHRCVVQRRRRSLRYAALAGRVAGPPAADIDVHATARLDPRRPSAAVDPSWLADDWPARQPSRRIDDRPSQPASTGQPPVRCRMQQSGRRVCLLLCCGRRVDVVVAVIRHGRWFQSIPHAALRVNVLAPSLSLERAS